LAWLARPTVLSAGFRNLFVDRLRGLVVFEQFCRGDAAASFLLLFHAGHEPLGFHPARSQRFARDFKMPRCRMGEPEPSTGPALETTPRDPGAFHGFELGRDRALEATGRGLAVLRGEPLFDRAVHDEFDGFERLLALHRALEAVS